MTYSLSSIHELVASNANGSTTMEGPLSTDRLAGHTFSLPRREAPRANTIGSWGSAFGLKSSIPLIHTNQAERPFIQQKSVPETATAQRELPGGFWEWTYCVPNKMCLLKRGQCDVLHKCNVNTCKEEPFRGKAQMGLWGRFLVGEEKGGVGGISKWAFHSVMNQRCFRSCWPFHNSIDSVTGQQKKGHGMKKKKHLRLTGKRKLWKEERRLTFKG